MRLAAEGRYWRGRLRAAAGDVAGAADDLHRARAVYERIRAHDCLWRVDAALSALAARAGDAAGAAATRERAAATLDGLASRVNHPERRAALLRQFEDAIHA
jgi:hypothetical protein